MDLQAATALNLMYDQFRGNSFQLEVSIRNPPDVRKISRCMVELSAEDKLAQLVSLPLLCSLNLSTSLFTAVFVMTCSCLRRVRANIYRKSGKLFSVSLLNMNPFYMWCI